MPWYFFIIELVAYTFAALLLRHAARQGTRWLSTCAWAMAFGLCVELAIVINAQDTAQHYVYGQFLIMLGPEGRQVPLWVGCGWGSIVYVASFTAQRLRSPWYLRPLSAGVLAVNIDLSLDPLAEYLGYWKWHNVEPINLYGVPLDNFLGWFIIVSSFALCARGGFKWVPAGRWGRDIWVPPIAGLFAVALVLGAGAVADRLYRLPFGQVILFAVVFVTASAITWGFALRSRRDNPANWPVLSFALVIHGLMLILAFTTGAIERQSTLMVLIPMNLLVGFFAYSWASIDTLFPVKAALPATEPGTVDAGTGLEGQLAQSLERIPAQAVPQAEP